MRFGCERNLSVWLQGVRNHAPALSEREELSPAQRAAEWLMLGLRTVRGLDPAEFEALFHRPFSGFLPFLNQCRQAGYAVSEDGRWHLTPRGFLLSNQIIGQLLDLSDF